MVVTANHGINWNQLESISRLTGLGVGVALKRIDIHLYSQESNKRSAKKFTNGGAAACQTRI